MVLENTSTTISNKHCIACNKDFAESLVNCPDDGSFLMPVYQDPLIGTKLSDRYEIISLIGEGGMGVVYKARQAVMDRFVAIKMLQAKLISDASSVKRFYHEAKAVSRLNQPNIISIFDFGVSPIGQPYLVMDYLEGTSVAEIIRKEGKVGVDRSIRIFSQTCDALEHAHEQGVVHRDLKPSNIMLIEKDDERDFVKVVDFGVAKLVSAADEESQRLTQTGEICGSPVYMSPEQCLGQLLDARSDIYSMGIMIYEALTGQLPLLGPNVVDTMSKHISEIPKSFADVRPDLYIPERLEAVVFKALQKNPSHRHQSMLELKQELISAIPQPARSQTLRTMVPKEPNQFRQNKSESKSLASTVIGTAIVVSSLSAAFGWLAGTGLLAKMIPSLANPKHATRMTPTIARKQSPVAPATTKDIPVSKAIPLVKVPDLTHPAVDDTFAITANTVKPAVDTQASNSTNGKQVSALPSNTSDSSLSKAVETISTPAVKAAFTPAPTAKFSSPIAALPPVNSTNSITAIHTQPSYTKAATAEKKTIKSAEQPSKKDPSVRQTTLARIFANEISVEALEGKPASDYPIPPLVTSATPTPVLTPLLTPLHMVAAANTSKKPVQPHGSLITNRPVKTAIKPSLAHRKDLQAKPKSRSFANNHSASEPRSFAAKGDVWTDLLRSRTY